MSGSFNQIILMGNVTRDPESRTVGSNDKQVVRFGICQSTRLRSEGQEPREKKLFLTVNVWGALGGFVMDRVRKGMPLMVKGSLAERSYVDKDGVNRKDYCIEADNVQVLEPSRRAEDTAGGTASGEYVAPQRQQQSAPVQAGPPRQQQPARQPYNNNRPAPAPRPTVAAPTNGPVNDGGYPADDSGPGFGDDEGCNGGTAAPAPARSWGPGRAPAPAPRPPAPSNAAPRQNPNYNNRQQAPVHTAPPQQARPPVGSEGDVDPADLCDVPF